LIPNGFWDNLTYESLVEEISKIYETALADGDADWNKSVLVSNWKIGERIVEVEQNKVFRAKYGEKIIQTLAQDLNRKLGSGFSARNLRYMRKFYQEYKIQKINSQINWTNYRLLLSVENSKNRKDLEEQIVEQSLTSQELLAMIASIKESENSEKPGGKNEFGDDDKGDFSQKLLKRPKLGLFTYRVGRNFSINLARVVPNLDLGFRVKYELGDNSGLDGFKSGDLVSVRKSRNSFQFEKIASVRELFTYKAYLDRVVDGDTLLVQIDLGFGIFMEQRLRLRGLDAPEVESKDGQKARKFVERELDGCKFLILKTHGSDIYDRYLVDVFYLKDEWKTEKVIEEGNFLNNRLLLEGLAKRL